MFFTEVVVAWCVARRSTMDNAVQSLVRFERRRMLQILQMASCPLRESSLEPLILRLCDGIELLGASFGPSLGGRVCRGS
jgi:hypothetical protein